MFVKPCPAKHTTFSRSRYCHPVGASRLHPVARRLVVVVDLVAIINLDGFQIKSRRHALRNNRQPELRRPLRQ